MNESKQYPTDGMQAGPVETLERVPSVLIAASDLSRAVLEGLPEASAQRIIEADAAGEGFFKLQATVRAPASWALLWKPRGKEPERIAAGPGTFQVDDLQLACFEGARAFVEAGLAGLPEEIRTPLGVLIFQHCAHCRVDVHFGGATGWEVHLYGVVTDGPSKGVHHLGVQKEAPQERLH